MPAGTPLNASGALLADGVVSLREIVPDDIETLYSLRMDPTARPMFRDPEIVPRESHRRMIQHYFEMPSKDCWFMIEACRKVVGTIALYNFADDARACEWGRFVIEPASRSLGFGRRALMLLLDYSQAAGIQKLRCRVFAGNAVALSLYRDLGFVQTAVHRHDGRDFIDLTADLNVRVTPGRGI